MKLVFSVRWVGNVRCILNTVWPFPYPLTQTEQYNQNRWHRGTDGTMGDHAVSFRQASRPFQSQHQQYDHQSGTSNYGYGIFSSDPYAGLIHDTEPQMLLKPFSPIKNAYIFGHEKSF